MQTTRTYGNTTANPVLMAPMVAIALGATLGWLLLVVGPALAYRGATRAYQAAARYLRRRRAAYRATVRAAALPRMAGVHATAHLNAARPVRSSGAPLANAARLLRWLPGTPAVSFATAAPAAPAPAPVRYPAPARLADVRPVRHPAPALVPVAVPVVAPVPVPAPAPQQDAPAPAIPYGWGSVATPAPGTTAEEAARTGRPLWEVSRDRRRAARKLALAAAREQEPNADGPLPAPGATDRTPAEQYDRASFAQLRQECKGRGLPAGGKADALRARLRQHDAAAA